MGRINYTFANKYSLSVTGRSDGSSRLAPGNKWAFFPSFGAAWQLGEEPFMKGFTWLDQLKVRGSYGTTGNTSISPYQTQGTLSPKLYTFGTTRVRGYRPGTIPNPDLTWEKTDQTDIGVEFSMFNNRLSGSVDGYSQHTRDLLLGRRTTRSTACHRTPIAGCCATCCVANGSSMASSSPTGMPSASSPTGTTSPPIWRTPRASRWTPRSTSSCRTSRRTRRWSAR